MDKVLALAGSGPFSNEEDIYNQAGLAFIAPELREDYDEIELAKANQLPVLIKV